MIRVLEGEVEVLGVHEVVIHVQGVGYLVKMPLHEVAQMAVLPGDSVNHSTVSGLSRARINIFTAMRENSIELYGFLDSLGLKLFQLIIKVSGVGPKIGMAVLSTLSYTELVNAIENEDVKVLSKVPGIGKKSAARIVLELRDKVEKVVGHMPGLEHGDNAFDDAKSALLELGYKEATVEKVLRSLKDEMVEANEVELVRAALQRL